MNIIRIYNAVTDFFRRAHFWYVFFVSSASYGLANQMTNIFWNFAALFSLFLAIGSFVMACYYSFFKNKGTNEISESKPIYLSLQEAAQFLSETINLPKSILPWIPRFPGVKTMSEMFWERDNPSNVHGEVLDKEMTIPFINLCLYMLKKNNLEVYGKNPLSKDNSSIPYEVINYFDVDYKKIYSHIGRDSTSLIYNEVEVLKDDLVKAIKNTDVDVLLKEINQ